MPQVRMKRGSRAALRDMGIDMEEREERGSFENIGAAIKKTFNRGSSRGASGHDSVADKIRRMSSKVSPMALIESLSYREHENGDEMTTSSERGYGRSHSKSPSPTLSTRKVRS
jgi:hypothetical protein